MRLLVTGDRHWTDVPFIESVLREHITVQLVCGDPIRWLIHGAADGADTIAKYIAIDMGLPVISWPAHWRHDRHCPLGCSDMCGRAAGSIRNNRMATYLTPNLVLAFHDDLWKGSKGTHHMVETAVKMGIRTLYYTHKKEGCYEVTKNDLPKLGRCRRTSVTHSADDGSPGRMWS